MQSPETLFNGTNPWAIEKPFMQLYKTRLFGIEQALIPQETHRACCATRSKHGRAGMPVVELTSDSNGRQREGRQQQVP